jgi:hypothetical protein
MISIRDTVRSEKRTAKGRTLKNQHFKGRKRRGDRESGIV